MSTAATTSSPHTKFPTHGLLPRADTQAADFVRKHPTYDGRGTVVAILDTGIDPGAQGLQVTSDGKRKIVDFVDCTGAGDVHLTAAARPLNGELKGASGRQLKVNAQWPNPTGEWRVGTKRLYDLIPEPLVARVREEREASFKKAAQRLSDSVASAQSAAEDDEAKAELGAQEGVLKSLSASYADPGPLLDCVVFHDGNQWRAAIDTEETGDLRQAEALGAYKLTGDVGKLCKRQLFYYTLNFYNEGGVLSIVTNVGSHSTHVAGILAANHPDEPQNNGVAPGAQLLSLMIGDHRVGSLETGVGLTRAASAIVEHSADLANMSYGEPSATSNAGQWVQMVRREVVRRHRCIFVSSAGNEGPALSTAGAPGGTSDDIIGVGAYVGYEQIKAEYAMYDTVKDTVFTWCSRGPTTDGARGVDIYAPGSAIASFPAYTLQRLQLGNGTSMSSPNLCGCLALLVSAWKQEFAKQSEQKISPYRVKNAIIATAKPFGGDDLGAGLVQTDAAWAFLKKHAQRSYEDVEYAVRIGELDNARGIYLRNAEDSAVARHLTVTVAPVFPGDARAELDNDRGGEHGELQSQRKFDFEQRVILTASESWVRVPEALYVSSDGRSFSVKVDATQLEPGRLHVAEIKGYDSRDVDRGEIFSIPITVTKPLGVDSSACVRFPQLRFQPTETTRRFIAVPQGATKAWITIRAANASPASSAPASFYLHCLQLAPQYRFTQYELKTRVSIGHATYVAGAGSAEQSYVKSMDVVGGRTLEVCIAPFWNQLDVHEIDVSVEFNGIIPSGAGAPAYSGDSGLVPGVVLNGNTTIARVDFTAPVRPEYDFKPVATLDTLRTALRPISSSIAPLLAERDTHLESGVAIQKLVLDYKYATQADKTTVRLRLPAVDSMIYENWADDFALYVFDANKKRVAAQISYTAPLTLDKKGDYLIRVQVRHRSAKDLEALKSAPLLVDTTL
ncbi:subtilisin-like protein, partial [Martensiomyces pterosporus]